MQRRPAKETDGRRIGVLVELVPGGHFSASDTHPVRLYPVAGFSCTCKGFAHWHGCTHHALLVKPLG